MLATVPAGEHLTAVREVAVSGWDSQFALVCG